MLTDVTKSWLSPSLSYKAMGFLAVSLILQVLMVSWITFLHHIALTEAAEAEKISRHRQHYQ